MELFSIRLALDWNTFKTMKTTILKTFAQCFFLFLLMISAPSSSHAATLSLDDVTFSISSPGGSFTTTVYAARWGLWDNSTQIFTELAEGGTGFADVTSNGPEMSVYLTRSDNAGLPIGTPLALAIYADKDTQDSQSLLFLNATHAVILTDSAWTAEDFSVLAGEFPEVFSSTTSAKLGTFNYNGGNEAFTLALIPEPSSASLVLLGAVSLVALRRLRKV